MARPFAHFSGAWGCWLGVNKETMANYLEITCAEVNLHPLEMLIKTQQKWILSILWSDVAQMTQLIMSEPLLWFLKWLSNWFISFHLERLHDEFRYLFETAVCLVTEQKLDLAGEEHFSGSQMDISRENTKHKSIWVLTYCVNNVCHLCKILWFSPSILC